MVRRPIFKLALLSRALIFLIVAPLEGAAATIEIYEQYGTYALDTPPPEMRPIVLSIPEQFLYGSTKKDSRNWGVNILTYYPSFTDSQDLANANFGLRCVGICNGRILISVENRKHSIDSNSVSMADFIAGTQFRWWKTPPYPSNVQIRDLDHKNEGFDEAFERVTTSNNPSRDETHDGARVQRTYLKRTSDRSHYDLVAVCSATEVKTACTLHFSLHCNPAIYVSVHGVDGSYLNRATDVQIKTDRFISAMVASPPCGN